MLVDFLQDETGDYLLLTDETGTTIMELDDYTISHLKAGLNRLHWHRKFKDLGKGASVTAGLLGVAFLLVIGTTVFFAGV